MLLQDQLSVLLGILQKISLGQGKEATTEFEAFLKAHPTDAHLYLMHFFEGQGLSAEHISVRLVSGVLLKNLVKESPCRIQIKDRVAALLNAPERPVYSTAANVVTSLFDPNTDMRLIYALAEYGSQKNSIGHMMALLEILGDHAYEVAEGLGERGMGTLVDALVVTIPRQPLLAIECINELSLTGSDAFESRIPAIISAIGSLTDVNPTLRRTICLCLGFLLDGCPDAVRPYWPALRNYLLESMKSVIPEVATEAMDTWRVSLLERGEVDLECLDELLRALMLCLPYTEDDPEFEEFKAGKDEPSHPDTNLQTRHHRRAQHGAEEDEEEDDDDEDSAWTPRKAAAACLDALAGVAPPSALIPVLLPLLEQMLASQDWRILEAGIIAIGAINAAGGQASEAIEPFLPQLMQFILDKGLMPKTQHALVRSISAWTLGRWSHWIASRPEDPLLENVIYALEHGLLNEDSKRLQRASASSLASLVMQGRIPSNLIDSILKTCTQTLSPNTCPQRTRNAVYELLQCLYESKPGNQPTYLMLVGVLMRCWQVETETSNDDTLVDHLVPLIECLISVIANGGEYLPPGMSLFKELRDKALISIKTGLERSQRKQEEHELDLCSAGIDLLDALLPFIRGTLQDDHLLAVLQLSCNHDNPGLRQAGFALLGDCAQQGYALNPSFLQNQLLAYISKNLLVSRPSRCNVSVANNAAWSLGELASAGTLSSFNLRPLLEILREIMLTANGNKENKRIEDDEYDGDWDVMDPAYLGNVAVAFARCASTNPPLYSSLSDVALVSAWELCMANVVLESEKAEAIQGMQSIIKTK